MKTANAALTNMLSANDTFLMADIFTFTLVTGDIYRWTSADIDITYLGNVYKSGGSLIKRGTIKNTVGVEVDTLSIALFPSPLDLISNIKLSTAILSFGFLDNAKLELRKCFFTDWATPIGDLILFMGTVADIVGTGTQIDVNVKSKIEVLNAQVPRNLYQASCMNSVYDTICQANKSSVTVLGSVIGGTVSSLTSSINQSDSYYSLGVLTFTSGLNIGVKRTVKSYVSGLFTFSLPLPFSPVSGDAFSVYPGCDNTKSTCSSKFNNLIHFRGMPYIPVPETSI